jgi:hypothetical protein
LRAHHQGAFCNSGASVQSAGHRAQRPGSSVRSRDNPSRLRTASPGMFPFPSG